MPKCNAYKQKGGSSDFMHSFYSNTAVGGPAAISQATLAGINNAPMFNPLSSSATVPGVSTGIVPTGLYLASAQSGGGYGCSGQQGGKQRGGISTKKLRDTCNANGISCRTQNGGYKHRSTMIKQLGGLFQ